MGYPNQNYNNGFNPPFRNNQGYNNQPQPQQQYKSSGAKYTKIKSDGPKDGYYHVAAWRMTKQGLMKATAMPLQSYSESGKPLGVIEHVGEQKGHTHIRYKVEIVCGAQYTKFYTTMRLDTRMLVIRELGLVISPNGNGVTRSGKRVTGYFGRNYKK